MILTNEVRPVPLKDIRISGANVRLTDKAADIEELAKSIEKHGLLQPIILKGVYGSPPYEVIVGQRRFQALNLIKEKGKVKNGSISAVFLSKDVDEWELKILSLTENIQRVALNTSDKMEAITALYIHFGKNPDRVARELGIHPNTVREYVKLDAQATPKAKRLLKKGKIKKEDLKRAIMAAQGSVVKIDKLLEELPKLTKYESERAAAYGEENPVATVSQIIAAAKKPKLETTIYLKLTKRIVAGLEKAKRQLSMPVSAIAEKALEEWLKEKGFL